MRRLSVVVLVGLLATVGRATPAQASGFVLSGAQEAQLEAWLCGCSLTLSVLFSHDADNALDATTAADFHAAADGMGETFTVLRARDIIGYQTGSDGSPIVNYENAIPLFFEDANGDVIGSAPFQLIGGYNPQSWSTAGDNLTPLDADRTAFIFNLTNSTKSDQKLSGTDDLYSAIQTRNALTMGPSFGAFDIQLGHDLEVAGAYLYHSSYGLPGTGDAGAQTHPAAYAPRANGCIYGVCYTDAVKPWFNPPTGASYLKVSDVRVYKITRDPTEIPEPTSLLLMGAGLLGLTAVYRRRKTTGTTN